MANLITLIPIRNKEEISSQPFGELISSFLKEGENSVPCGAFCYTVYDSKKEIIGEIWLNEDINQFLDNEVQQVYLNAGSYKEIELLKLLIKSGDLDEESKGLTMVHTGNKRQKDLIKFLHLHFGCFYFDEGNDRIIGPDYDWDDRPVWIKKLDFKRKQIKIWSLKKLLAFLEWLYARF